MWKCYELIVEDKQAYWRSLLILSTNDPFGKLVTGDTPRRRVDERREIIPRIQNVMYGLTKNVGSLTQVHPYSAENKTGPYGWFNVDCNEITKHLVIPAMVSQAPKITPRISSYAMLEKRIIVILEVSQAQEMVVEFLTSWSERTAICITHYKPLKHKRWSKRDSFLIRFFTISLLLYSCAIPGYKSGKKDRIMRLHPKVFLYKKSFPR